jgi:integrase
LLLLFFCGLRRSEVVKVESGDFYQDRGHILLNVHGKGRGDKSDTVMIPEQVWPEIRDFIKDKDGPLFTAQSRNTKYNRSDNPISANRVYLLFKEYCRMAGIDADAFSPHSTRATYITLCLSGGADVRSVMYASRHSDPSTTIRYDRQRMDIENHASKYLSIQTNPTTENNPEQP